MAIDLSILYRGPLSSCNYDCTYCPFAKQRDPQQLLNRDRAQLARFVSWVKQYTAGQLGVFFTPWGEALVRKWYRDALVSLSNLQHVKRVAVQTNLSCSLRWLEECDKTKVGLWCTFHPTQISLDRFLKKCYLLDAMGVRYSVGVVGLKEHFSDIEALREKLHRHTYLWVNAYKRDPGYYAASDIDRLAVVDPLFEINNRRHASLGRVCNAGHTSISVDGDGNAKRCHFVAEPIGNIYDPEFGNSLRPRRCPQATCGCHIGYVNLPELQLESLFGDGMLDRIPQKPITRNDAHWRLRSFDSKLPPGVDQPLVQVSVSGR